MTNGDPRDLSGVAMARLAPPAAAQRLFVRRFGDGKSRGGLFLACLVVLVLPRRLPRLYVKLCWSDLIRRSL